MAPCVVTLAETRLSARSSHAQKATLCRGYQPHPLRTEARLRIQDITNYFRGKKKSMTEAGVPQDNLVVAFFFLNASCKTHHPQANSLYSSIKAASEVRFPPSACRFPTTASFITVSNRKSSVTHRRAQKYSRMWDPRPCQI